MIAQMGDTLVCVGQFTTAGAGATGLTVTCNVYELTFADTPAVATIVTGGSATELAKGCYYYALAAASVDAKALYVFVFSTAGTCDLKDVVQGWAAGMDWTENLDAATTSRLAPTTAARTLDVTAGGCAGIDWANVEAPTTALDLSGTSTKALEPTVDGRTLDVSVTGEAGIDWANIGAPTTSVDLSATSTMALEPTVDGRKLDVSAGGEAGLDWANVGSPTTAVDLSATSTLALEPTVDGRKLDVSAGGEAGVDWANVGTPNTAVNLANTTVKTVSDLAGTFFDPTTDEVETGVTWLESQRLVLASQAGKLSGAPGGPIVIRDINDTADRITATVDADGNRTGVVVVTA